MGLLNWITQISMSMRCWLLLPRCDLSHIPDSHYSIDPDHWNRVRDCLSDNLQFVSKPTGTGIPMGSPLLAARHQDFPGNADIFYNFIYRNVAFGYDFVTQIPSNAS